MTTSTLVLVERSAYIALATYIGLSILILNHRLARRLNVELDTFDRLARYGIGVAWLVHAAVAVAVQLGAPPEWRLPLVDVALFAVAIGIARDLWWPKDPRSG